MANLVGQPNVDNIIEGTMQDDTITGANWNDVLRGRGGNDTIRGAEGNDHLYGDASNDSLFGGNNNDHLEGGRGDDFLDGGAAVDVLVGGDGDDTFHVSNRGAFSAAGTDRDVIADFTCDDTISADGFGNMTWDSPNANLLNAAGFTVYHLNNQEGANLVATHDAGSLHWDWTLGA